MAQPKPISHLRIRTKIWIENDQGELLFGKGKTEILELIESEGSIARAAALMELSYKKAWNHIKILQNNISDELVVSRKGISGGTLLTPKAIELIRNYRQLQNDLEAYAEHRFQELFATNPPTPTSLDEHNGHDL
ncbi:MAG: winged helix-turn-helix domain-containing protein [Desulfopila sp.]